MGSIYWDCFKLIKLKIILILRKFQEFFKSSPDGALSLIENFKKTRSCDFAVLRVRLFWHFKFNRFLRRFNLEWKSVQLFFETQNTAYEIE